MTPGALTVPRILKALGGTTIALSQTSMACTLMGRAIAVECAGTAGSTPMNLSRGLR